MKLIFFKSRRKKKKNMHKYILLLFTIFTFHLNAQVGDDYLLIGSWTKVKTRMLDGSKDLTETSAESKLDEWKFTNDKLCISVNSNPIFPNESPCNNYVLEKNFIRTFQFYGYKIEKLTKDSLIVVASNEETSKDKIKKQWFVKTSNIKNAIFEKTKNDSVIIATKNFTPTLKGNLMMNVCKELDKEGRFPNYNLIGNIVFFPKKNKIKLEINNLDEIKKYNHFVGIQKSVIENSVDQWDFSNFMHFDKVILPMIYGTKIRKNKDGRYDDLCTVNFFTNNVNNINNGKPVLANDGEDYKKVYIEGLKSLQQKNYSDALSKLKKSYELNNRNVDALYNIAAIYSLQNDNENACKTLKTLKDLEQTEGTKLFDKYCTK